MSDKPVKRKTNAKTRPFTPFDWDVFNALVQFKVTLPFCADYMGVSTCKIKRELRRNYDKTFVEYSELKVARVGLKLQQKAVEMALKGDRTMLIFCLKNLAKWKDKDDNEDLLNAISEFTLNYAPKSQRDVSPKAKAIDVKATEEE